MAGDAGQSPQARERACRPSHPHGRGEGPSRAIRASSSPASKAGWTRAIPSTRSRPCGGAFRARASSGSWAATISNNSRAGKNWPGILRAVPVAVVRRPARRSPRSRRDRCGASASRTGWGPRPPCCCWTGGARRKARPGCARLSWSRACRHAKSAIRNGGHALTRTKAPAPRKAAPAAKKAVKKSAKKPAKKPAAKKKTKPPARKKTPARAAATSDLLTRILASLDDDKAENIVTIDLEGARRSATPR